MTVVRMSLKGARELRATFARLPKAVGTSVLIRAATAGIIPIRDAARAGAPSRTGNLRSEIVEAVVGVSPEAVEVAVSWRHGTASRTPAFYGLFVHEGTGTRTRKSGGTTGRMRSNPFLVRAFDGEMGAAERITKQAFVSAIRRAVRRG